MIWIQVYAYTPNGYARSLGNHYLMANVYTANGAAETMSWYDLGQLLGGN